MLKKILKKQLINSVNIIIKREVEMIKITNKEIIIYI